MKIKHHSQFFFLRITIKIGHFVPPCKHISTTGIHLKFSPCMLHLLVFQLEHFILKYVCNILLNILSTDITSHQKRFTIFAFCKTIQCVIPFMRSSHLHLLPWGTYRTHDSYIGISPSVHHPGETQYFCIHLTMYLPLFPSITLQ